MKRYHLADVLTLCEVIAGVILLGMVFLRTPPEIAIWVFVFGELCDAFDGPLSRRWPYPDDGKSRWWRTYVVQIEHASDIFLSVVCMFYLLNHPSYAIRAGAFVLGLTVATMCFIIEVAVRGMERERDHNLDDLATWFIMARRWVYLAGIAGGVAMLIWGTGWSELVKQALTILGLAIGVALFFYKLDRALSP